MSDVRGPAGLTAGPRPDARARLRRTAHQLEGVFLNQLFQAMRASVPRDGLIGQAPGQDVFTSLLDQRLADVTAERMKSGLGEALYRQLSRRLPAEGTPAKPETEP